MQSDEQKAFEEMLIAVRNGLITGKLNLKQDMPTLINQIKQETVSEIMQFDRSTIHDLIIREVEKDIVSAQRLAKKASDEAEYSLDLTQNNQKKLAILSQKMTTIKPASWLAFCGYIITTLSALIMFSTTLFLLWQVWFGQLWSWVNSQAFGITTVLKVIGFIIAIVLIFFIGLMISLTPMMILEWLKSKFGKDRLS